MFASTDVGLDLEELEELDELDEDEDVAENIANRLPTPFVFELVSSCFFFRAACSACFFCSKLGNFFACSSSD